MPDRETIIRWVSLAAYFLAAFLIFAFFLFPFDLIKTRIESEVRGRTPLELTVGRISPRFFNRFALTDVVLSTKDGSVLFESPKTRITVSLFGLVRGLLSLEVNADAYGGSLNAKAVQGRARQDWSLDADGLDIGSYAALKPLGLKLAGKLGGNFEMTGDAGRGRLWIKGLTSRDLKVQGFPVPDLDFEDCWLEADVKGDRLTIKKLELNGKELKARLQGDLVMRANGTLNLTVKLKPSERLAQEQSVLFALLKNKDVDGYYQFSIGGTVSAPMPRL